MYVNTEYDDIFMVQQHSQLFHVVLLLHLYLSHQQAPDSTNTKHQVVKLCMFRTFWQFAQIWNCVVHSVNCQIACQFINCVRDFEIMQSTVQFRNGCFWARYAPVLDTVHGKLAAVPWREGLACTRNFININLFWKRGSLEPIEPSWPSLRIQGPGVTFWNTSKTIKKKNGNLDQDDPVSSANIFLQAVVTALLKKNSSAPVKDIAQSFYS